MKNILIQKRLGLVGSILGIVVAFFGAYQMIGRIRTVDILTLFFGGFGAGAGMIKMILDYRKERNRN
ncbi:MAG: hypothetical protein EHM64_03550 [Ignavibacteriae bacterium]|nr:MAG: hypothetical protein EHM64_03550 [Ignavibacteriota bacterium]